jgi:hypothetical protein
MRSKVNARLQVENILMEIHIKKHAWLKLNQDFWPHENRSVVLGPQERASRDSQIASPA